jgi:GlcNAc-P-P-Und epimerase
MSAGKILVTGCSGFIGRQVCDILRQEGAAVHGIDVCAPPECNIIFHKVNLMNGGEVHRVVNEIKPNVIYNLAARTDLLGSSIGEYSVNYVGVINIIEASLSAKIKPKFIHASTRLVFDPAKPPKNEWDYSANTHYGMSKVKAEEYLRSIKAEEIPWVIVRPTSIWGPHFNEPFFNFFMAIKRRMYFHPSGGKIHKSMGYVKNAAFQIISISKADAEKVVGRQFFIADPWPVEVDDFSCRIAKAFLVRLPTKVPRWSLRTTAFLGDLLKAMSFGRYNPPLTTFRYNNIITNCVYDLSQTISICPSVPYSLEEAIKETVDWMRAQER